MRRIGHRGARGHAPDNTIASFQKAYELGCDDVETDVWLIDGALVIAHDRPTSTAGLLTLDQVLDFCAGKMGVDVEIKCADGETAARDSGRAVARAIVLRSDPSLYISSFWWDALLASREAAPEVRCAYLFASSPERASLIAEAKRAGLWGLHPNRTYATAPLVRAAHEAGLAVQVWTVNEPDEIARFVSLGVDGICSDYPERVPT